MSDNIHNLFGDGPDDGDSDIHPNVFPGDVDINGLPELTPQQAEQIKTVKRILLDPSHTQRVVSAAVVLRDELDPESTAFRILNTIIDEEEE